MAIVLGDVKSPAGDIDPAVWFPGMSGGDVDTLLTGYIADAYTKTGDDDAAEQWVYYRAATAVADKKSNIAGMSASLSDQGSATFPASGWQYWDLKAKAYLLAFEAAETAASAADGSPWAVVTSLRHN